jgi:DNA-directed RNA polymerase specialized sigma24 family protein
MDKTATAGFHDRFARCSSLLHFTASRILASPEGAELAVRNCWLRASCNPPSFRDDGAFRSWLVRLLIDEALSIIRQSRSQDSTLPTFIGACS